MRAFSALEMPRGHRPGRHEDRRQMAERQRADEKPRHDLVADAQHSARVEGVVGSATAVAMAITSRENSDSSMPGWPCVMPSHMAGTPPANCAVQPSARAASLMMSG